MVDIKTDHTPGPYTWTMASPEWAYDGQILDQEGNLLAIVAGHNFGTYFGGKDRKWGDNHEEEDYTEHVANARLFAGSSEMLDALLEAREYVCAWNAVNGSEESLTTLKKCNTIIAKVLGE